MVELIKKGYYDIYVFYNFCLFIFQSDVKYWEKLQKDFDEMFKYVVACVVKIPTHFFIITQEI